MIGKVRMAIAGGIVLCMIPVALFSQSITVPTSTKNTRFYSDIFNIKRPGLSINGFDSGVDNSHGYGLKLILTLKGVDSEMDNEFQQIASTADKSIINPSTPPSGQFGLTVVNNNSNILQCRAFMALAKYILYKNGQTSASDYGTAIGSLRSAFLNNPYYFFLVDGRITSDAVKSTRSIGDYARAVDLYLVLENAYRFYGFDQHDQADSLEYINSNSSTLLTKTQKETVLSDLMGVMYEVQLNLLFHDSISGHLFEPGNRPLKQFVSIGYAALGMQHFFYVHDDTTFFYTTAACNTLLQNAFRGAGL